jgi:hypothetical protein
MGWQTIIIEPTKAMLTRAGVFIPLLVGVILILVIGWLIAKALQQIVTRALKAIQLDNISEKGGLADILARGEIRYTLSELIGIIVYWLGMLIVIVTAINAIGLTVAAELLDKIVLYIPNVVAGIFILVIGMFLATFVAGLVRTTAANAGIGQAKGLAQIAQVVIIIFAIIIALDQFIRTEVLRSSLSIILASTGLGLALAFGLGCKDIAGRFVSDLIDKARGKK